MDESTFSTLCQLIHEESGISLQHGKEALMSARISKRMRALKIESFDDYLNVLQADPSGSELTELLDVISTNVTSFYREPEHFDYLNEALQKWKAGGQTKFRIWSAACSTGEEPYTIAMSASEILDNTCDLRILATDISTRVLRNAELGRYQDRHVENIPDAKVKRYFTKEKTAGEAVYNINAELRRLIVFKRLNLSSSPFPMRGPFDVVFCRNVMIYFQNGTRSKLLSEIHRLLRPGGLLMVGHSESLSGITSGFKVVRPSVYTK